jgi:hypothetical protein
MSSSTNPNFASGEPLQPPPTSRGSSSTALGPDLAKGLADGFTEASQAFSDEIGGSSTYSELCESVLAGMLRANGRFLDELAATSRRVSQEFSGRRLRESPRTEIDYALLADLIAARLKDSPATPA